VQLLNAIIAILPGIGMGLLVVAIGRNERRAKERTRARGGFGVPPRPMPAPAAPDDASTNCRIVQYDGPGGGFMSLQPGESITGGSLREKAPR
jgi:hypothetical protein